MRGRGAKRQTSSALLTTYLSHLWSKTTCLRLTAYARSRQFEQNLPRGAVPGRIWRNIVLVHLLQKVSKVVSKKGSLNRPIPTLNFISSDPFLDPWKSKCQSLSRQQHAGSPQIPSTKINYFPYERGRTSDFDVQHRRKKRFAQLNI